MERDNNNVTGDIQDTDTAAALHVAVMAMAADMDTEAAAECSL